MTKEQFIEIIKGFDIKEIEEYKIKYKDSKNHSAIIQLGFDEDGQVSYIKVQHLFTTEDVKNKIKEILKGSDKE